MNTETEALRRLARQMAAVADSAQLLEILCTAAADQCGAAGAAVVRSTGDSGAVVAATGELRVAVRREFPLRGSLLRELATSRDVVSAEAFTSSERPLALVVPELRIGPMLIAPLIAHGRLLGGLAVGRVEGGAGFTQGDRERLRVIADHAALAVWKADLLAEAQAADRAKGRFIATISHELRTPLTALTGYGELLGDGVLGPVTDAQADVLERMRSVTHHLTAMIEEVLTFSSIEAGGEVVRTTDFLLADLMHAVCAIVEPLAKHRKLGFVARFPDEPIRLVSDADKVRQVVVNLAGNAVKFTDRGEVTIDCRVEGGLVHIAVADTGIGIPAAAVDRLFQPFSQLDTGLTRRHGGTGLGLYISRRLAELLGGGITVVSELGKGSTFTLTLRRE